MLSMSAFRGKADIPCNGSVDAFMSIVGRIIEARGFLAYPTYIQSQIMPLCDVHTVALAGDTLAERQRDEVVYYKSSGAGSGPYDIPVARMDAHGGLISTAIDVVRFAIHLDGLPAVHDRQCPMVTDTLTAKRNSSCKQRRALRCPSNTQGQVQANPGSSAFRACNC
jgi:hypothetical protein